MAGPGSPWAQASSRKAHTAQRYTVLSSFRHICLLPLALTFLQLSCADACLTDFVFYLAPLLRGTWHRSCVSLSPAFAPYFDSPAAAAAVAVDCLADLKPQNLFLNERDDLLIGDFGIAKMLDSTHCCAKTTIGTPYYFSPELCQVR